MPTPIPFADDAGTAAWRARHAPPAAPRGRRVERCRRDLWVIRTREVPRLCIDRLLIAYQQFL